MNEFTSERKIMSVVVRDCASGRYYSFVKGAESKIMERLSETAAQSPMKDQINREVLRFGSKGLRTLVFAMKELS